jgi:hypothetical protein
MTEPVRRVHYFAGQLLTPEDLQAEQDYHRDMRYLHNRLLGHGVVSGLDVTVGDGSTVIISAGLAIDLCGRELVVPEDVSVDVSVEVKGTTEPDGSRDVIATWEQVPDSFAVPAEDGAAEAAFSRWLERPRLALVPPGGAPDGSVVLGRVLFSGDRVVGVDVGGRSGWRRPDTVETERRVFEEATDANSPDRLAD